MKHIIKLSSAIILSLLIFSEGFSQTDEYKKLLKTANTHFKKSEYYDALDIYKKLLNNPHIEGKEKAQLLYNTGFCYYASDMDKNEAIQYFSSYIELSDSLFEVYNFLGELAQINHDFDKAIDYYKKFREKLIESSDVPEFLLENLTAFIDRDIEKCEYGKFLLQYPVRVKTTSLSGGINTIYSEYGPVLSPDNTKFVFTRRSPETLGGRISDDGDYYEDIYVSNISEAIENQEDTIAIGDYSGLKDLIFSYPLNFGQSVNSEVHEGAIQFSSDGNKLYIYRKSKIWVSVLKKNKWKKAKVQKEFQGVLNQKAFEPSISISSDGYTIFFSSERPGGLGGLDIYKSEKDVNGKWSAPVNLGANINTEYDEDSPFISADGKTLYFSSKGFNNMGWYDVYKSTFDGNNWSAPENMGYPVNSAGNDIFFILSTDGKRAYYSSNKIGGSGKMDIYEITFANNYLPLDENVKAIQDSLKKIEEARQLAIQDSIAEAKRIAEADSLAMLNTDSLTTNADSSTFSNTNTKSDISVNTEIITKENKKNTSNVGTTDIVYKIQIGAFKKGVNEKRFKNIKDLVVITYEDGFTRYFSGEFRNYDEARIARDKLIENNFKGSFIVGFKEGELFLLGKENIK